MARRKAIVRRLSAVEALGSVTVIATDKTGTLTENRMHVKALETADEARALKAMVLANDAELGARVGDPLEIALIELRGRPGPRRRNVSDDRVRLSSRPFDSADGFMRVTVEEDGRAVSYLKGAPEVILARSSLSELQSAQPGRRRPTRKPREGYRVLALGWCAGEAETELTFLGLVLLWDPPRAGGARRFAARASRRHPRDHDHRRPPGHRRDGRRGDRNQAAPGADRPDIDRMSADELRAAVRDCDVFARAAPEHKLKLVEALKAAGEIVAVTGDGVNDAPALKRADVGVAMGRRGSDVAREVADLVLMDDNFATIVAAIEEGRSIYENIQKCIRFLFSTNLALVLLVVGGLGLSFLFDIRDPDGGLFLLPLTAVQLLWINVLGRRRARARAHLRPQPRRHAPEAAAGRRAACSIAVPLRFIVVSGLAKAFAGIVLSVLLPFLGYAILETRTAVFLYESIAELVFAYPSRRITSIRCAIRSCMWPCWASSCCRS